MCGHAMYSWVNLRPMPVVVQGAFKHLSIVAVGVHVPPQGAAGPPSVGDGDGHTSCLCDTLAQCSCELA